MKCLKCPNQMYSVYIIHILHVKGIYEKMMAFGYFSYSQNSRHMM